MRYNKNMMTIWIETLMLFFLTAKVIIPLPKEFVMKPTFLFLLQAMTNMEVYIIQVITRGRKRPEMSENLCYLLRPGMYTQGI